MKKKYLWIIPAVIITLGFFYGIYLLTTKNTTAKDEVEFYKMSDQSRPRLKVVGEAFKNIGNLEVKDEKTATFVLQNAGEKPLFIIKGSTNCMCTFGKLRKGDFETGLFGMHPNQDIAVKLDPQEKAELDVVYKPYLMPVYGKVQRAATLSTNDPEHPKAEFVIEAFVE